MAGTWPALLVTDLEFKVAGFTTAKAKVDSDEKSPLTARFLPFPGIMLTRQTRPSRSFVLASLVPYLQWHSMRQGGDMHCFACWCTAIALCSTKIVSAHLNNWWGIERRLAIVMSWWRILMTEKIWGKRILQIFTRSSITKHSGLVLSLRMAKFGVQRMIHKITGPIFDMSPLILVLVDNVRWTQDFLAYLLKTLKGRLHGLIRELLKDVCNWVIKQNLELKIRSGGFWSSIGWRPWYP